MTDRTGFITALLLVVLATGLSSQIRASEYVLLRWAAPPEEDVAGYKIYIVDGCAYPMSRLDIGFSARDPRGVASYPVELHDDGEEYDVMLSAYRASGVE